MNGCQQIDVTKRRNIETEDESSLHERFASATLRRLMIFYTTIADAYICCF